MGSRRHEMSLGAWVTLIGAAAVVVGSLLTWTVLPIGGGLVRLGTDLNLNVFFTWDELNLADSFFLSAGMVTALLGVLAGGGAFLGSPWTTRIAGGVATLALALVAIRFISETGPSYGLLLALAGGIATVVGTYLDRPGQGAGV